MELIDEPLTAAAPQLRDDIRRAFMDVERILGTYETKTGYRSYTAVSATDRNRLKTSMANLSELLAQVAGALNLEVTG
jgi:iron uptake system EfeUOB component EfeO/EfeM